MLISNYYKFRKKIMGNFILLDPKVEQVYSELSTFITHFPYHDINSSILLEYWTYPNDKIARIFGYNQYTIRNNKSRMNREIESYIPRTYVKDLEKLNYLVLKDLQETGSIKEEELQKIQEMYAVLRINKGMLKYYPNKLGIAEYYKDLYGSKEKCKSKYDIKDIQTELNTVIEISRPKVMNKLSKMNRDKLQYVMHIMLQVPKDKEEEEKRIKILQYAQEQWKK